MKIHALTTLLLEITNVLLIPVIGILLFFLVATVVYLGGFLRETYQRWIHGAEFRSFVNACKTEDQPRIDLQDLPSAPGLIGLGKQNLIESPSHSEQVLDDLQLLAERKLTPLKMGIRLGPIFGLAGTLIPLGPALMSLSTGNIQLLSSKLVVAFSTTVLGLLIGGICFAMKVVRQNWYNQDLNDLEFIAEHITSNEKHQKSRTSE